MPILIQELIASDSISQAVDKINFNFDQILLNGGGPIGPPGPLGPPGPIGGRGERGSLWFEDTSSAPGTDPNALTFTGLVAGDNYLQSNGDVWTWSGLTWSLTSVNLLGPQGPGGSSGAWLKFGSDIGVSNINRNAIYPEPFGQANGANNANEGISTVVIGAVVSSTPPASNPITPTNALINDVLAAQIDSGIVAAMIHQKTSGARAIMFHGGVDALDYYEQSIIANLANMSLETDDTMSINVPKRLIDPQSSLIGFSLNTDASGQLFRSGRDITFNTGLDTTLYNLTSVPDSSNFNVNAKQIPGLDFPEINLDQYDSSNINQAKIQIGGTITSSEPTRSTVNTGKIVADAGFTYIYGRNLIRMRGAQIDVFADNAVSITAPSAITLTAPSINNVGNVFITGTLYVDLSAAVNGNLQTNSNLQVGLNTNLLGALNVNGLSTFNGEVVLNNVNPGTGDVLVRNNSTNKVELLVGATPIPLGGIIMWSGSTPPTGWAVCDGSISNGVQTPDLRGRFVVGASTNDWNDIRLNKPNYNSFTLAPGFLSASTPNNLTQFFPATSGYPYYAINGPFPAITGVARTFYRWDGVGGFGINLPVSSNNPPSRYFWTETKVISGQWKTFLRSASSTNYNNDLIGYSPASDPFTAIYAGRLPVTTDKLVAPAIYVTTPSGGGGQWFFAWHATSRSYRIYYSLSTITNFSTPPNWDPNIQVNTQICFLDRSVGVGNINNNGFGFWGTSINDRIAGARFGDAKTGPGWGTWAWDNSGYVNGIRLDFPTSLIQWDTQKRKFNVNEYGGGRQYKISEAQLPSHKHNGLGERAGGNWPDSILGGVSQEGVGSGVLGSNGGMDPDNAMFGTTYSGSNNFIEDSTPYYALAYIMYVGT
jgi:microcystin-dependent protein